MVIFALRSLMHIGLKPALRRCGSTKTAQIASVRDFAAIGCKCANIQFGEPFQKRWFFK
tara:strand:- start:56 stop:232 length:177 start_codon:yes stop_codon:yes gene_type:complete